MNVGTLAKRVATAAAAVTPQKDWPATLASIEVQIGGGHKRRLRLVEERDGLALGAVEGDADAVRRLEVVESGIETVDRELARLHVARERAALRVAAEERVEADRLEAERMVKAKAAIGAWHKAAGKVDAAVDDLAGALVEFNKAAEHLWHAAQAGASSSNRTELGNHIAAVKMAVVPLVGQRLCASGYVFKGLPGIEPDKAKIASRLSDPVYLASLARGEQ